MAEGEHFKRGDVILELEGPADVLLKGKGLPSTYFKD